MKQRRDQDNNNMAATPANAAKHATDRPKTSAADCMGNIANKIRETSGKATTMRTQLKRAMGDVFKLRERVLTDKQIDQFIWQFLDYAHDPANKTLDSQRKAAKLREFAIELLSDTQRRLEDAVARAAK